MGMWMGMGMTMTMTVTMATVIVNLCKLECVWHHASLLEVYVILKSGVESIHAIYTKTYTSVWTYRRGAASVETREVKNSRITVANGCECVITCWIFRVLYEQNHCSPAEFSLCNYIRKSVCTYIQYVHTARATDAYRAIIKSLVVQGRKQNSARRKKRREKKRERLGSNTMWTQVGDRRRRRRMGGEWERRERSEKPRGGQGEGYGARARARRSTVAALICDFIDRYWSPITLISWEQGRREEGRGSNEQRTIQRGSSVISGVWFRTRGYLPTFRAGKTARGGATT